MKKRKHQAWFRIAVQILFFLYAPSIYNSAFTAVKNTFVAFGAGTPLEMNTFVMHFILVIGFTVLFGRFFCGWACSFGALNDWVYRFVQWILKKMKIKPPVLPDLIVSIFQWIKYLILAGILFLCFTGRASMVSKNSPWTAFSLIISGNMKALPGYLPGILILAVIIIGMGLKERFFCQFLCPMGAVFSLLPVVPFFGLKRDNTTCPPKCGACRKVCPVNLLMEDDSLKLGECIRCGRCSGICPKGNITSCRFLKGNELWMDGAKALLLIILIFILSHIS